MIMEKKIFSSKLCFMMTFYDLMLFLNKYFWTNLHFLRKLVFTFKSFTLCLIITVWWLVWWLFCLKDIYIYHEIKRKRRNGCGEQIRIQIIKYDNIVDCQ